MPTTNRTSGAGRVIMNPPRPKPAELKLGKFTTTAPGVTVKSSTLNKNPNSPVNVTISRTVRPFSEAGTLSVKVNGETLKLPIKGTDRPEAIAKKLEKALEAFNPNFEVRITPAGNWGSQPVGVSKTELVIGLKEHFQPGGALGPTINPAPRPAPKPTVNPAPPPPTKPKPTVNPAPPPPTKPKPTVNPAPPPPTKPKPTLNPAPKPKPNPVAPTFNPAPKPRDIE